MNPPKNIGSNVHFNKPAVECVAAIEDSNTAGASAIQQNASVRSPVDAPSDRFTTMRDSRSTRDTVATPDPRQLDLFTTVEV